MIDLHMHIEPQTEGVVESRPDMTVHLDGQDVLLTFDPCTPLIPQTDLWVGFTVLALVQGTEVGRLVISMIPDAHMVAHTARIYPYLHRHTGRIITAPETDLPRHLQEACAVLGIAAPKVPSAHARMELHTTVLPQIEHALVAHHAASVLDFRRIYVDRPFLDILRADDAGIAELMVRAGARWMAEAGFSLAIQETDYNLKRHGLITLLPLRPLVSRTEPGVVIPRLFEMDLRASIPAKDARIAAREQGYHQELMREHRRWSWHRQRGTLPGLTEVQRARAGFFPWHVAG